MNQPLPDTAGAEPPPEPREGPPMADYPTDEFLETRLAANVKRLRQRLSISSDELAHATGLHLTVIEAIETGAHNSDLATLDALGRGLRIDPGELLAAR